MKGVKQQFEHLDGIIIIDSLDNLDELESDIEEFSVHTGLQVKETKTVGLNGLNAVIDEAIKKLENKTAAIGCKLKNPFGLLSFLALPVIPELRLTDLGLVDVNKFELVELFE